jgi:hypothetical protein
MPGTKRGERSTGGSRPEYRAAAAREEDDFKALLAERPAPADGRGTPLNIIRRPLELPPMEPVKDQGG